MGEDGGRKYDVKSLVRILEYIGGRVKRTSWVIPRVLDVRPSEAEVLVSWRESLIEESNLRLAYLEAVIGPTGGEHIAQRKSDASETASNFQHGAFPANAAVDPEEHAPLLRPAEPLLEDVNPLRPHQLYRRKKLRLIGKLQASNASGQGGAYSVEFPTKRMIITPFQRVCRRSQARSYR